MVVVALAALASPAASAPPATVTCTSIIDPGGSSTWRPRRVVLGVVAVPPKHLPQTVPAGEAMWPCWSKAGLVVRAGSPPIRISVPGAWSRRVAVGWGDGGLADVLRVSPRPPSSSLGDWNHYAGGFVLRSRAACVPLTFTVAGRSATVWFGVGKRCA